MKIIFRYIITSAACFFLLFVHSSIGQEKINNSLISCDKLMNSGYISDGQEYFAELNKNNLAKFHTTFYGGARYRIVACSNITDHPMILKVMDAEKNILFNNKNHDYAPYWNLAFTSTVNCVIVIEVPANQPINKPVKLLIGFKDKPVDSNPIDTNLQ